MSTVSSETAESCRWRLIWIRVRRYSRVEASFIWCPNGAAGYSDGRGCPAYQLVLMGSGPAVAAIAVLASAAGLQLDIATPSNATRLELRHLGFKAKPITPQTLPDFAQIDRWTAAVLAFHEHNWEPPLLKWLLRTDCFYVGALGSRNVQSNRAQELEQLGLLCKFDHSIAKPDRTNPGSAQPSNVGRGDSSGNRAGGQRARLRDITRGYSFRAGWDSSGKAGCECRCSEKLRRDGARR